MSVRVQPVLAISPDSKAASREPMVGGRVAKLVGMKALDTGSLGAPAQGTAGR